MNLFVKEKTLTISDTKIIVKEIGITYMMLSDEEKKDTKKVLALHTSLSVDEIDSLTIEAFNYILDEFYKLNEKHFEQPTQGDEEVEK